MLYQVAEKVLSVPYVLNGFDLSGWDCRGLVSWCRATWLGLPSPSLDGWYPVEQANDRRFVEAAIKARLDAWVVGDRKPGSVALFDVGGRVSHVALMLDDHNFLHTRESYNTCVDSLHQKKWLRRFQGAYELR